MQSKVAFDPEEPSLGRIQTDSIAPPHSPATIKLYISRVERIPPFADADLFADTSCITSLKEGHISIFGTDCPDLSPKKPLAIVRSSTPDGRCVIKNRAADIYWVWSDHKVYFWSTTMEKARNSKDAQVNEHSPVIQVFRG